MFDTLSDIEDNAIEMQRAINTVMFITGDPGPEQEWDWPEGWEIHSFPTPELLELWMENRLCGECCHHIDECVCDVFATVYHVPDGMVRCDFGYYEPEDVWIGLAVPKSDEEAGDHLCHLWTKHSGGEYYVVNIATLDENENVISGDSVHGFLGIENAVSAMNAWQNNIVCQ